MGNLFSDIRYCLRGFARRPLFAVVVVTTLALGLSINAAIFSIYDQILLRELPVPDPDGLVNLGSPGIKQGNTSCNDGGTCDEIFSYPMFRDLERIDGPFVGLAAHRYVDASLAFEGETATGSGLLVSGQYFSLLGVRPTAGRLLDTNDDRVDGEASAVVLTYAYWESSFGADPTVVGRTLVVNGKPLTIVGVGPRDFHGTTVGERPLVFVPITFRWLSNPNAFPQHADRRSYWAYLFARLKPGVSPEQAEAAINVPYRSIVNEVDAPLLSGVSEQQLAAFRAKTIVLTPGDRGQSRIDDNARTRAHDPARRDGPRAAHRVRERRELVARARLDARRRDRGARLARGLADPVAHAVARRNSAARGRCRAREHTSDPSRITRHSGDVARVQRNDARRDSRRARDGGHARLGRRLDSRVRHDPRAQAHRSRREPRAPNPGHAADRRQGRGAFSRDAHDGADRVVDGVARARRVVRSEPGQRRARRSRVSRGIARASSRSRRNATATQRSNRPRCSLASRRSSRRSRASRPRPHRAWRCSTTASGVPTSASKASRQPPKPTRTST